MSTGFGWFAVTQELTATADARLFVCEHRPAHRAYFLRLTDAETRRWRGNSDAAAPRNATVEAENARTVATSTGRFYPDQYFNRARTAASQNIVVPQYYGVRDDRYLIPASAVYRRRGAVPFETILDIPGSMMQIFPFWENLWLLLVSETSLLGGGSNTFEQWRDRWGHLVASSDLGRKLIRQMPENLPGRLVAAITEAAAPGSADEGPALEESAVFRLIIAYAGRQLTEDQVTASLSCPFFRMNVTLSDLHYVVALRGLLEPQPWLMQEPLEWLGPSVLVLPHMLHALARQPSAFPDDREDFEPTTAPDEATLERFSLFLRDPEQTNRPYLALQRTRRSG